MKKKPFRLLPIAAGCLSLALLASAPAQTPAPAATPVAEQLPAMNAAKIAEWWRGTETRLFQEAVVAAGRECHREYDKLYIVDAGTLIVPVALQERLDDTVLPRLQAHLKRGGSVIFYVPERFGEINRVFTPFRMEQVLPVNIWSFRTVRYRRLSTGARLPASANAADPGTPFAALLKEHGFRLPWRFDLHLPYSTIESGEHRYEWERLGKPLLNTDWKTLLHTDQDGQLPLLVSGRAFAGKIFMFGGDLYNAEFQKWSGYNAFIKELLELAHPQAPATVAAATPAQPRGFFSRAPQAPAAPATAAEVAQLGIAIPPVQPVPSVREAAAAPMLVEVENPLAKPVTVVFAVKVRNGMRSLMNSYSTEITLPAGKKTVLPIVETAPELTNTPATRTSDDATPFRHLQVGLSALDRQEISKEANQMVDRTPAVTLALEGEDTRDFSKTEGWPAGGFQVHEITGASIDRFVYFAGQKPKVTVRLRNALHNIALLARASDLGWPENPTIQGLNDNAYSFAGLRGAYEIYGYWSGKSAEQQRLKLDWPLPVTVAGQRLLAQGEFRRWNKSNPLHYSVKAEPAKAGAGAVTLASVTGATYEHAQRTDRFAWPDGAKPQPVKSAELEVIGLDPLEKLELRSFATVLPNVTSNCSLGEWEVYGWPSATLPKAAKGKLVVTLHDLSDDKRTTLLEKEVEVEALSEFVETLELPTRDALGEVRVSAEFIPAKAAAAQADADLPFLFIPPGRDHLIEHAGLSDYTCGYLCSPGFCAIDIFGTGTMKDTEGWGGPDDKAWAWALDLMEVGRHSKEAPSRMLESPAGMSHYTNPWHDFPSGQPVWEWIADKFLERFRDGDLTGKKAFHMTLSDRWNGIPIGAMFMWADFIAFDKHLRAQGKPGLKGKTRRAIAEEIVTEYGDQYQVFWLNRTTDQFLELQRRLKEIGVAFSVTTHGSFPIAGGELGEKLSRVVRGVGTDLFWELRDEDLFKAIGYRFGVVAVNPDLRSGAYNEWGWVSGELENRTWYATSGDVEPSRRQWYATYSTGRVTTPGEFKPYTVYGFERQGSYGGKNTASDWQHFNRAQSITIWLRPEEPTGFGIVASWQLQLNRMTPNSVDMRFGLFPGKEYRSVEQQVGELYQKTLKNGVPVSFVASTHTLKNWKGSQPLLITDGFETDPWEIAEFDRLNKLGAPIIAVGSEHRSGRKEAEAFFGIAWQEQGWQAQAGTEVVNDDLGAPFAYVRQQKGRPAVVFCPVPIMEITGPQSKILSALCKKVAGEPLTLPEGVGSVAFINNGSLFLTLGTQSDDATNLSVSLRPALLNPKFAGLKATAKAPVPFRVMEYTTATIIPAQWNGEELRFTLPVGANDGRMIQIMPLADR